MPPSVSTPRRSATAAKKVSASARTLQESARDDLEAAQAAALLEEARTRQHGPIARWASEAAARLERSASEHDERYNGTFHRVQPMKARLVIFSSGMENLHQVTKA